MSKQVMLGTSYTAMPDGRIRIVVSSAERGKLFDVTMSRDEAVDNLRALAIALGLVVSEQL